jgi:polysaccharide biosynthesis/export protein
MPGGAPVTLSRALRALAFPVAMLGPGSGALVLAGCTGLGPFVWVDRYQEPQHDVAAASAGYVIAPGDVLNVRVFDKDNMSAPRARVRSDGKVSLPFLNDVEAAGCTPAVLAERLQTALKAFVNEPVVTVSVEEARPCLISVIGEVARPGVYPLEGCGSPLQALASAGGMTQYGHPDRIFVLRSVPPAPPVRIRFRYTQLLHAQGPAARFQLQRGDVVVVE